MGGGGYGRHHGQSSTSDVFILDRVARKAEPDSEEAQEVSEKPRRGVFKKGGSRYGGSKQLNLDKPRITKALSVDDGQLRLTKPLDVSTNTSTVELDFKNILISDVLEDMPANMG